ncbi:MAG: LytTR family DNA-binding domain-containing protein [Pseudobutyrivibrio sp.]|nr:LytTR family DNA-binding domain-containing protein [Pseudobutyrivibrio sp.]
MMRIAICDDDISFTSKVEELLLKELNAVETKAEIDIFFDGDSLVKAMSFGERYSLILMDIEMKKVDGIMAAKAIRQIDKSVLIIYISGYDSYLKELFEVEPFRYISKPLAIDKFKKYFMEAIHEISKNENYIKYTFNGEESRVALKDIVYFESNNRIITIHLNDGSERKFYGKLNKLEKEELKDNNSFIRIHQSYLINYYYVKKVTFSEVVLVKKGQELCLGISEDRKSKVRNSICKIAASKTNES